MRLSIISATSDSSLSLTTRPCACAGSNPHLLLFPPPPLDGPITDQESCSEIVRRKHRHHSRAGQEIWRQPGIPDPLRLNIERGQDEQQHRGEKPTSNKPESPSQRAI